MGGRFHVEGDNSARLSGSVNELLWSICKKTDAKQRKEIMGRC